MLGKFFQLLKIKCRATVLADCFNALKILYKHPNIDSSKVFITGPVEVQLTGIAEKLAPEGERFHISFIGQRK